jgi:hypothetical protein
MSARDTSSPGPRERKRAATRTLDRLIEADRPAASDPRAGGGPVLDRGEAT